MSDTTALVLLCGLAGAAVVACRSRNVLQPNRTAAAIYLAGSLAWGLAVVGVCVAWAASSSVEVCGAEGCDSLVETLEDGEPAGLFLEAEWPDVAPATD